MIRRVLFGKSDFDFDRHMEIGGVLLVNTAKGELVNLARVLGKIVLMNLQNATFRRTPIVSSFHHILVDEAPDYLYNAFREFPAQSRKYKVIVTTLQQTIAQLADQFGEHYMTTLIGTMRNRMVYGDVPGYDAKYFSDMFGEKVVYEEGQSEMSVSPLQESPQSRSGSSYSKVKEQAMSGGDIMFQDAFECAVKIVYKNKPMPVVQIKANFVPREDFVQAKIMVNEEELNVWLAERRAYGLKPTPEEVELQSIESTETKEHLENYEADSKAAFVLDPVMVEKAVRTEVDPHPREAIIYQPAAPIPSPTPIGRKREGGTAGVHIPVSATDVLVKERQEQPSEVVNEEVVVSKLGTSSLLEDYDVTQARKKQQALEQAQKEAAVTEEPAPQKKGDYEESQLSEETEKFFAKLNMKEYEEK